MFPAVIALFIFALFWGSRVYLVFPAVSLSNILFPFVVMSLAVLFGARKHAKEIWVIVFALFTYPILAFTHVVFFHNPEQLKDLFYTVQVPILFLCTYTLASVYYTKGEQALYLSKLFKYGKWTYYLIAAAVVFQFLGILGIVPRIWEREVHEGIFTITGPYSNPNNLAAIFFLMFGFLLFLGDHLGIKEGKKRLILTCIVILLLTLSRSILLFFILFYYFWLLHKQRYLKFVAVSLASVVIFAAGISLLFNLEWVAASSSEHPLLVTNLNRLIAIRNILEGGTDNSSFLRLSSYWYFLQNILDTYSGIGSGGYFQFYQNAEFDIELISQNPHSFWIETAIAYSFWTPLFMLFGIFYMWIQARGSWHSVFTIMALFTVLLANVPSTIIRSPVVWLPLFLVFSIAYWERRTSGNTASPER